MMLEVQKFIYWRGQKQNQFVHGYIYTPDKSIATLYLAKQGIKIARLKSQWRFIKSRKLKSQTTISFYRQLAALLQAGVSLTQALSTLTSMQKTFFQNVLASVRMHIEVGNSFYASLLQHPRYFDKFSCQLIHIAENTGTLDKMLTQLASHHEKRKALRDKVKQALLYPAFIFTTAILITLIMLLFVVPQFESIFKDFNAPLPAMTTFVIQVSQILRQDYWLLCLPLVLILYLRKFPVPLRAIPFLFNLLQCYFSAKYAHALSLMLNAGVPISIALILLEKLDLNEKSTSDMQRLQSKIAKGFSLHAAMMDSVLFSPLLLQMVKVGEESGMVSDMLQHAADLHDNELQHITQQFTQLLEPLIILMLGVLIGSLVISMYLPIFKLGTVL